MKRQMKVIFAPRDDNVAERWKAQYMQPDGSWKYIRAGDSEIIYNNLVSLGHAPSPSAIAQVVGNTSWAPGVECDCCESRESKVIEIGSEYSSLKVCLVCLENAAAVLVNVRGPDERAR